MAEIKRELPEWITEDWLDENVPELLEECENEERAREEILDLIRHDGHYDKALINVSVPGGHDLLQSFRRQVLEWLNTEPGERQYETPLSERQLYIAHDWRGGYQRRRSY